MEKGIIPVIKRELKKMVSRPIYIMMTVFIPIIIILFFSTFLNKGMPTNLPIAVVDLDQSSTSRLIIRNIGAGPSCEIKHKPLSFEEARDLMQRENLCLRVNSQELPSRPTNRKVPRGSILYRICSLLSWFAGNERIKYHISNHVLGGKP